MYSSSHRFLMRCSGGSCDSTKYKEWTPEMIGFLMEILDPAVIRTLLRNHNNSSVNGLSNAPTYGLSSTLNYWCAHPTGVGQNTRSDEDYNPFSSMLTENDARKSHGNSFESQDGLDSVVPNNRLHQSVVASRQDVFRYVPQQDNRSKQRVGDHELFCKFCYVKCCSIKEQQGQSLPEAVDDGPWRHHKLYDGDGLVVSCYYSCPRLFQTRCRTCGATGRVAHTTKFCPLTNPDYSEKMNLNSHHFLNNSGYLTGIRNGHHIN